MSREKLCQIIRDRRASASRSRSARPGESAKQVQTIKQLDGALLLNTEYGGKDWWFEVQSDQISFLFKLWIVTGRLAT
jgi:hypothetical protein